MSLAALELAAPAALWGLLAAAPILVFHLYFRRRRRVLVAFAPLLVESAGLVRSEARFKRLREALSLVLRLLALACAVLALGGLRPAEAVEPPRDLFLVIDADITSVAREADGALRLEHARRLAQGFVLGLPTRAGDDLRTEGQVAVVLAGRAPRLVLAPTDELTRALDTLALPLSPETAAADLEAAVATAAGAASRSARAALVVLSARPIQAPTLPPHVTWQVVGTGSTREDQGFVDLVVERTADASAYRVRATVRNDAAETRSRSVVVHVGTREIAREDAVLEAGVPLDVTFDVPAPPEALWLRVTLEGEDAYPANDAVAARLAPMPLPSVLVVHDGAVRPYTAAVVEALAAEGLIDGSRGGYVAAAKLAQAGAHDVVIVDGVALPAAGLRPGAYVFLAPLVGTLPFDVGRRVQEPLIWRTARGHPLVEGLDFRKSFVVRGQALAGEGLVPLAWAEGLPVIAEGEREGVRFVVLGLDPEGSALPTQLALPRIVRNAVLRLARAPHVALAPFYRVGEVLRPRTAIPGGPRARIAWTGPEADPVLAEGGQGVAAGRVDPEGVAWRVPAGAAGRVTVTTGAEGPAPWTGQTAFLDLETGRSIVPARPEGQAPPPGPARTQTGLRWRRGLLALAVLLLLLDLALLGLARRRAAA